MKKIWQSWKRITEKVGNFQAKIIFSILYFLLIAPVGFLSSNSDYFGLKQFPKWLPTEDNSSTLKKMKSQ